MKFNKPTGKKNIYTEDSFANFNARLGIQTNQIGGNSSATGAHYALGPYLSRLRIELEAAYRGNWLVGRLVDTVAEDMTKEGIQVFSEMEPDDIDRIQVSLSELSIWRSLASTIKWARLYGGAVAVMLIEGAEYSQPLRIDTIRKGQFKGLVVLDRWMLQPSMGELITEMCPDIGMPKYYEAIPGVSTFPGVKIHHTRLLRFDGIELPYYQKLFENLWGLSVIERAYDRLIAFDSATQGAAQLLYKAHLRVLQMEGLREALAMGGKEEAAVIKNMMYIRAFQSNEAITLLDAKDQFNTHQYSFGGISDLLKEFGQQISGALEIPLVRLFGQSPSGFSTGDTDLKNYYDHIGKLQENNLRPRLQRLLEVVSMSRLGKPLPEDFSFQFAPLWQMTESEKATIAQSDSSTVTNLVGGGVLSKATGLKELRQSSRVTGRFTNITDEDIEAAENEPPPGGEFPGMEGQTPGEENPDLEALGGEPPGDQSGEVGADLGNEVDDNTPLAEPATLLGRMRKRYKENKRQELLDRLRRRWKEEGYGEESDVADDDEDTLLARLRQRWQEKYGQKDEDAIQGGDAHLFTEEELHESTKPSLVERLRRRWNDAIGFIKDVFKEEEHPRDDSGEFSAKGGGGSSRKAAKATPKSATATLQSTKRIKGELVSADGKPLPEHVKNLRIPPAWTDVVFSSDANSAIYVKGKDAKGRVQYLYSPAHKSKASAAKFSRIDELNEKFKSVQLQNLKNRASKDKATAEAATVLDLIMVTGIRPGGDTDTKAAKKAYGATTLEGRHVKSLADGGVALNFIGKKGVECNIPVRDKLLAKLLVNRAKKAGKDGKIFKCDNVSLLKYSSSLDGGGFKTKDFRTLLGTKEAMAQVKELPAPKNEKEYKKTVKKVAKKVAAVLGNTPSVALRSYIHPVVFAEWRTKLEQK